MVMKWLRRVFYFPTFIMYSIVKHSLLKDKSMILEASDTMILGSSYDETTDLSSYYQLTTDTDEMIKKATLSVNFGTREVIGLEKWANQEDDLVTSLKSLSNDALLAVLDNFPISVIKNYLV